MKPALYRHSVVQAREGRRLTRVVTGNWRVLLNCVWWREIAGEFAVSLPRFCRAGMSVQRRAFAGFLILPPPPRLCFFAAILPILPVAPPDPPSRSPAAPAAPLPGFHRS